MGAVAEETVSKVASDGRSRQRIIDIDVHHTVRDWSDLQPYLAEPWRTKIVNGGSRVGGLGYLSPAGHRRKDAVPVDGSTPGSDPPFLIKQLVEENRVEIGKARDTAAPMPANASKPATALSAWRATWPMPKGLSRCAPKPITIYL